MKLEVNIRKKYFFVIISTLLVLSGIFAVWAYRSNPANPSVFGHTANEIEGLTNSFTNIVTYTTEGPGTFTVPAGVTKLEVEVVGGGGGGYSTAGGSGGYAYKILTVTPGQQINYVVGLGEIINTDGGQSNFGTIVAFGGKSSSNGCKGGSYSGADLGARGIDCQFSRVDLRGGDGYKYAGVPSGYPFSRGQDWGETIATYGGSGRGDGDSGGGYSGGPGANGAIIVKW